MIGLAVLLLLLCNGRIAGVSGILEPERGDLLWRVLFFFGLLAGGLIMLWWRPVARDIRIDVSTPAVILAGLLVGLDVCIGSGRTSGHGACAESADWRRARSWRARCLSRPACSRSISCAPCSAELTMIGLLGTFCSGLLFAVCLGIAGMTLPQKVLAFLDVTGNWDPSLALVMVSSAGVYLLLHRLMLRHGNPITGTKFAMLIRRDIDAPLMAGAAMFGAGGRRAREYARGRAGALRLHDRRHVCLRHAARDR